jgi:winged helix-turn-helix/Domain of unknown function (DUF4910)
LRAAGSRAVDSRRLLTEVLARSDSAGPYVSDPGARIVNHRLVCELTWNAWTRSTHASPRSTGPRASSTSSRGDRIERQFDPPGFDLRCLNRSREGEYAEYHSSADSLDIISSASLEQSLLAVLGLIHTIELHGTYVNLAPYGEPQLGKRGLYPNVRGPAAGREQLAILWVLNQSDGKHSLLEIADRSGIRLSLSFDVTQKMVAAELLRAVDWA